MHDPAQTRHAEGYCRMVGRVPAVSLCGREVMWCNRMGAGQLGTISRRGLPDRTTDEDAVLTGSLEALANLSVGSLDLTDMLTQVATLAVRAIPGADGAGLTLLEIDRANLIVKSEPFVRAIDDIQYSIGEVPVSAR